MWWLCIRNTCGGGVLEARVAVGVLRARVVMGYKEHVWWWGY